MQLLEFFLLKKRRLGPVDRGRQSPQADVVGPPLGEYERKFDGEHRLQKGNVPREELLLQADGVRRNDERLARFCADFALAGDGQDCRDEIRKAFPDARPRFHDEVRLLRDGALDRGRHFELLRPLFVRSKPLGNASLFAEYGSRIRSHRSRR